ncbi:MAG: hypothetical protein EOO46_06655 [Flavobacterium sp.]|nr:MAG: hypothetical protein EOO46_06655 [Flavobacterium sp.]
MLTRATPILALLFTVLFTNSTTAQIKEGKFIGISAGLGLVAPDDKTDVTGNGFYAQGEYILNLNNWFGVRPYAGVIIASGTSDREEMKDYNMKSNAFMLGAKVRVAAPIPYVAPFIELGVGMSVGSFETYTPLTHVAKSGAIAHIPFTVGLAVGRDHGVDVKFTYYYHNSVEQFSGAAAVGLSFPIK